MPIPFKATALITIMMISTPLIVAVVVLAVGRVEKSTALFHAFHRISINILDPDGQSSYPR